MIDMPFTLEIDDDYHMGIVKEEGGDEGEK